MFRCPTMWSGELYTLRHAFPQVAQRLYPNKQPNTIPGQHLHFTQVSHKDRVNQATGISKGYHITINFNTRFKSMNRINVGLWKMEIFTWYRILQSHGYWHEHGNQRIGYVSLNYTSNNHMWTDHAQLLYQWPRVQELASSPLAHGKITCKDIRENLGRHL